MHEGSFVFAQLTSYLDRNKFNYLVRKYQGDSYIKHFSCWNQLKVLMFGQLSRRESLRDLIVAVEAHSGKAKFLGFGDSVTRSNLAKANQNRDCRIFEEYAFHMMELARNLNDTTIFNLGGTVYAFDSTTIELCLAVFCWANCADLAPSFGLILLLTSPKFSATAWSGSSFFILPNSLFSNVDLYNS